MRFPARRSLLCRLSRMGAVLLVFELLGVIYGICKWRSVHPLLLVQTAVTMLSFCSVVVCCSRK